MTDRNEVKEMAKAKIIGRAKTMFDFTNAQGQRVYGFTIHLGVEDSKVEGVAPEKFSINEECEAFKDIMNAPIGTTIEYYYKRSGGVDKSSIKVLK